MKLPYLNFTKTLIKKTIHESRYYYYRILSILAFIYKNASPPPRGYYKKTEDFLNVFLAREKRIERATISSARNFKRNLPKSVEDKLAPAFTANQNGCDPETFVVKIPEGRAVFDYGVVLTSDNKLLGDVAIDFGRTAREHSILFKKKLPKCNYLDKSVAVISSSGHQRYYHWMFDVLPRLYLLQQSNIQVDHYVVNKTIPFQKESLQILGIESDKIIEPSLDFCLRAKELVVPSLPGTVAHPTRFACEYLRSVFLINQTKNDDAQKSRKIYISRGDAQTRRIINEAEVITYLETKGFETFSLSSMTVLDQVNLFKNAAYIIAPHGAALSNTVFCAPNSVVVDIFPPGYMNVCFWILAEQLNLDYYYFMADEVSQKNSRNVCNDMIVNLKKLSLVVNQIL